MAFIKNAANKTNNPWFVNYILKKNGQTPATVSGGVTPSLTTVGSPSAPIPAPSLVSGRGGR